MFYGWCDYRCDIDWLLICDMNFVRLVIETIGTTEHVLISS